MKKLAFFLVGMIVVFGLMAIAIGGYLGFVPIVTGMFGSDKPKDLGVIATRAAFDQYQTKSGATIETLAQPVEGKTVVFSQPQPLTTSLTQEEITSRLALSPWPYMILDNIQVKINPDESVEVSGRVRLDRLEGFLAQVGGPGFTRADAEEGLAWLGLAPTNPIMYGKGRGSVTNNQATVQVDEVTVGRIPLPLDRIGANGVLTDIANDIITNVPGLDVQKADFANGQLNFTGTVPTKIEVWQRDK